MTRLQRILAAVMLLPVALALCVAVVARAQAPATSTGLILGQVIDAPNGKPIASAIVTLSFAAPPRPPLPPGTTLSQAEMAALQAASTPRRIMTDATGVFVFHSLQKGSYRLNVEAPGFLSGGFGQLRPNGPTRQLDVDQGERRTGLTIKLWPYCSISGTVIDEFGDPAVGVSLRLVRVTTVNGQRRLQPGSSTQTDDRGAYRFGQLSPGDYLVAAPQTVTSMPLSSVDMYMDAMSKPNGASSITDMNRDLQSSGAPSISGSGIRIGNQQFFTSLGPRPLAPPSSDAGKTFAYHTVFYPSVPTASEATLIAVAAGQERSGIDVQLRPVQTVRVSGFVTGPGGLVPNMGVKLIPSNADFFGADSGFETASTATDETGSFTFPAVPPGSYSVRVLRVPRPAPPPPPPPPALGGRAMPVPIPPPQPPQESLLWADTPVVVSDTDVTGIGVSLRLGSRISGRVAFDGSAPMPTPQQLQSLAFSVTSADGRPSVVNAVTRVAAGGVFTTVGYPPGKYVVSLNASSVQGWYFKGATLGGRSLDDEPLDLQGSDMSGLTLTFTDRTTQISGTVRDPAVMRDMSAMVLIFPANYATLIERGTIGRRSRSNTVGGSGAFMMSGLAPGEYLAAAVNPDNVTDVRDKAFYDALLRVATRFTLADGEKKTLDLTVGAIR